MGIGNYWPVSREVLNDVEPGSPFVCLYSGGKDSALALSIAMEKGKLYKIVQCVSKEEHKSIWHEQEEANMCQLLKKIGYDYEIISSSIWSNRSAFIRELIKYKNSGVTTVVCGDLYEEEQAKYERLLCLSAGLELKLPLWQKDFDKIMCEHEKRNIKSVISCVLKDSPLDPEKWLGRMFDRKAYDEFVRLGIDPLGEKGEFHTTVISADYFKNKVDYTLGEIEETKDVYRRVITVH